MKELTVKQLALLSGVTVRTLHHYDEIGLLKPAFTAANGYRYYGRDEWLRLQDIVLHRELGAPLAEIAKILDAQGPDRVAALRRHREKLKQERDRFATLITTIDRTIATLEENKPMTADDLYKGVSPDKQAAYEAWLIETQGDHLREPIAHSKAKWEQAGSDGQAQAMDELRRLETAIAAAMRAQVPVTDAKLHGLLGEHRAWVAKMWGRPCPPQAYAGLAAMYEGHPDFRARYEAIAPRFTDYLCSAMRAYAGAVKS